MKKEIVPEEREEFEKWLEQAEEDISSAKYNLDGEKYYVAAFLCEQTIEKALKALMIKDGQKLIKTHDLFLLSKKVGLPESFSSDLNDISGAYIDSRYCSTLEGDIPSELFDEDQIKKFINTAEEILEWIRKKI